VNIKTPMLDRTVDVPSTALFFFSTVTPKGLSEYRRRRKLYATWLAGWIQGEIQGLSGSTPRCSDDYIVMAP
jgi:hypothetical protein